MKLHYQLLTPTSIVTQPPVVLLHGLFGNLDNLGMLARELQVSATVIKVDLRNHGLSPHTNSMTYPEMAQDVLTLLNKLHIEKVSVIGHSMGGKVAMALTALAPQRIVKLVVIDIAPVAYNTRHHDGIFMALQTVSNAQIQQRQQAAQQLREYLHAENVVQFLLKSFHNGTWRFNLSTIIDQYSNILGWQETPSWSHSVLFICGSQSPYVQHVHRDAIARQFPQARAHIVTGAGHWVHAEKTDIVLNIIRRFLNYTA